MTFEVLRAEAVELTSVLDSDAGSVVQTGLGVAGI